MVPFSSSLTHHWVVISLQLCENECHVEIKMWETQFVPLGQEKGGGGERSVGFRFNSRNQLFASLTFYWMWAEKSLGGEWGNWATSTGSPPVKDYFFLHLAPPTFNKNGVGGCVCVWWALELLIFVASTSRLSISVAPSNYIIHNDMNL